MAIFAGALPYLNKVKHFDLFFCHNHLITKLNIWAKFERIR